MNNKVAQFAAGVYLVVSIFAMIHLMQRQPRLKQPPAYVVTDTVVVVVPCQARA